MLVKHKNLIILRGIPGAGKTTLASIIALPAAICSADDYFMVDGEYQFNATKLRHAHQYCQDKCKRLMSESVSNIVIANTSTTAKEMKPYVDMARAFDYNVHSIIVENRHGNKSVHGVPDETLNKMRERFSVEL